MVDKGSNRLRTFGKWVGIFFGSGFIAQALFAVSGWLVALAVAGGIAGAVWAKRHPEGIMLGQNGATLKKPFIAASIFIALFGMTEAGQRIKAEAQSSAKAILATKEENPTAFQAALAAAPNNVLEEMKTLAPEIYTAEMARRGATPTTEAPAGEAANVAVPTAEDQSKAPDAQNADAFEDKAKQGLWVAKGQEALEATLRDAASVKYKNVFYNTANLGGAKVPIACGQYNAKNAFGGYTGFQGFIYVGGDIGVITPDRMPKGQFAETWNKLCTS